MHIGLKQKKEGERERDWWKPEELAQGLQLSWGLTGFICQTLSSLSVDYLWLFLLARGIWVHSQKGLEEHGFRYLDPQNYIFPPQLWLPTQCGHCTGIWDPVYLNSATQVSHRTTVFQIAFSWRVSVSNYCSPDILGSLPPIWTTADYFLPTFLISVCFGIAFLSSPELSPPPIFASSKHFVKLSLSIFFKWPQSQLTYSLRWCYVALGKQFAFSRYDLWIEVTIFLALQQRSTCRKEATHNVEPWVSKRYSGENYF